MYALQAGVCQAQFQRNVLLFPVVQQLYQRAISSTKFILSQNINWTQKCKTNHKKYNILKGFADGMAISFLLRNFALLTLIS